MTLITLNHLLECHIAINDASYGNLARCGYSGVGQSIHCSAVPKTKITDHTGAWGPRSFDLRGGFDFNHNREYRLLKYIKGNICYFL